jgi:hypothetical protein
MKTILLTVGAILLGGWLAGTARAQNLDEVKARMLERAPTIEALVANKTVGENADGYLEFVGAAREQEALVAAENADRKLVYAAIAGKTNSTVELVARRRAQQIAEKAKPGTMLRDAAGAWSEKK